ncbi:MAG: hypothetical protein AB7F43_05630 [Bacteriovoracia bacterium]
MRCHRVVLFCIFIFFQIAHAVRTPESKQKALDTVVDVCKKNGTLTAELKELMSSEFGPDAKTKVTKFFDLQEKLAKIEVKNQLVTLKASKKNPTCFSCEYSGGFDLLSSANDIPYSRDYGPISSTNIYSREAVTEEFKFGEKKKVNFIGTVHMMGKTNYPKVTQPIFDQIWHGNPDVVIVEGVERRQVAPMPCWYLVLMVLDSDRLLKERSEMAVAIRTAVEKGIPVFGAEPNVSDFVNALRNPSKMKYPPPKGATTDDYFYFLTLQRYSLWQDVALSEDKKFDYRKAEEVLFERFQGNYDNWTDQKAVAPPIYKKKEDAINNLKAWYKRVNNEDLNLADPKLYDKVHPADKATYYTQNLAHFQYDVRDGSLRREIGLKLKENDSVTVIFGAAHLNFNRKVLKEDQNSMLSL